MRQPHAPEDLLFIDANIYLDMYHVRELAVFVDALAAASEHVFVTSQIAQEVRRRKLTVLVEDYRAALGRLDLSGASLAVQLDDPDVAGKEWNQRMERLDKEAKSLKGRFEDLAKRSLKKVMESEDPVSLALERVFTRAADATPSELEAARLRKERGNPPGKKGDSLGDQISWEQLLNASSRIQRLWIVSKDSDFCLEFRGEIFLNPFLVSELHGLNPRLKSYCFNSLTKALPDFRTRTRKRMTLPSPSKLEEIQRAEARAAASTLGLRGLEEIRRLIDFQANSITGWVPLPAGLPDVREHSNRLTGLPDSITLPAGISFEQMMRDRLLNKKP